MAYKFNPFTGNLDDTLGVPVSIANGGTGLSSYTIGDLLYASGATTLSKLADVATGSVLVSGGVGVAPAWSASPTITTSVTTPLLIGGTATTSALTYKTTTAVGAAGADHIWQMGNNGASEAMRLSQVTPSSATAYTNEGGTGDRRVLITETNSTGLFANQDLSWLINGVIAESAAWITNGLSASDCWMKFDFGTGKLITEAKWYQNNGATHGVWKWQGSNNDSDWTDIGATFTLGTGAGDAGGQIITTLSGNGTNYRYYRLQGVSGTTSSDPYTKEIEFKIGVAGTFYYYCGINQATPTATLNVKSYGTTTDIAYLVEDSAGADLFSILDNGVTTVKGNFSPITTDAAALGTTSLMWSDLFLASGAVINFNAGAETITHSANTLTFGGITLFDMATGIFEMNDAVRFDTGVAIVAASYSIGRDADGTNQLHLNVPTGATFEWSVNDVAQMTLSASTLALPVSGSIISMNAGNVTLTHSANALNLTANSINLADLTSTAIVFNNGGADVDFRGESDDATDLFYFDAGADTGAGAIGFFSQTPQVQQATIVDADGTLADITTKFNTLLADLEGYGLLKTA